MSIDENRRWLEQQWRSLARRRHDLALGIERIGLVSFRLPGLVAALALGLAIAAGFGIARIKIDDSLSQLFRSDTPAYRLYARESQLFPSSEFDVLVVIDGPTLLARSSIEKLRNLVTDLQLIDGTRGIISLFSARQPPEDGQLPAPLVPDELPQGAAYQQLVQRITSNEIIRGKLLSNDGRLTLIVLALDPDVTRSDHLSRVVSDIHKTVNADMALSGA
jgi:predicted RND superfamily exporter protein